MNICVLLGLLLCLVAVNAYKFRGQKGDYPSSFRGIDPLSDRYRRAKHDCQHNNRKNVGKHYWKNKYEKDLTKILYVLNDIAAEINKPVIIPVPYPYFTPINTNKPEDTLTKFDIEDYLRKFDAINKKEEIANSNSNAPNTKDVLRKMYNFTADNDKRTDDDNKDSDISENYEAIGRTTDSAQVNFNIGEVPETELRLGDYDN